MYTNDMNSARTEEKVTN